MGEKTRFIEEHCLGCRLVKQNEPVHIVYEDEWVVCILDIDPVNEGHTLVLPKEHYQELSHVPHNLLHALIDASAFISKVIQHCFQPDGIMIWQNGGEFNDLNHVHIHVIPRFKDDGFNWIEPTKFYGSKNAKDTQLKLTNEVNKLLKAEF